MPSTRYNYSPDLTLPNILRRAAASDSFIGLLNDKGEADIIPYSELLKEAEKIAAGLTNEGLQQDDKIIIATSTNRETIMLLWGAFLCGIIPTIMQPPPTFAGYNPPVVKLLNVYEQLNRPTVFMSAIPVSDDAPEINIKTVQSLDMSGNPPLVEIDPHTTAFIQFSSGSTGNPKGIVLTHFNIVVNLDAINYGLDIYPRKDVIGNWMPLFHDMGLIGYHLAAMYNDLVQWHIETIDFIKNPGLWLNMLSDKKVKVTGCPNFGLALTLRHLKRLKSRPAWDFSYVKALLNGAEPISVQIMNEFVKELEPHDFHPNAMMPVYGLAEATLAATFTPIMTPNIITSFDAVSLDKDGKAIEIKEADSSGNVAKSSGETYMSGNGKSVSALSEYTKNSEKPVIRDIVSVGVPINDIEILITDHAYIPVSEGDSGIIWIRGDSVTQGYYNRPDENCKVFAQGWFNTGDVGFFYKGNYYISGRDKDIIFRNGRHYFANDLETLACEIEGISYGKICIAGTTNHHTGEEEVIAFLAGSPGEKANETFRQLRNLLRSTLGITLDQLVMVRSNEIPKTSSGKLQRYKLIQKYVSGEFDSLITTGIE